MCTNNDIKFRAIQEFSDYNFFVDDYQSGYKWTVQQVLDLLKVDKITNFSFYRGGEIWAKKSIKSDVNIWFLFSTQPFE